MPRDPAKLRSNRARWRNRNKGHIAAYARRYWASHAHEWARRRAKARKTVPNHIAALGLSIITARQLRTPETFLVHRAGTVVKENWETPDELAHRLEKKGALIVPKKEQNPRQPKKLDPATAREILRASSVDRTEEATKEEIELELRTQMLLLDTDKTNEPEKAHALAIEICELYWKQYDLMQKLQAIARTDLQQRGFEYVLDEKQ